MTRPGVDDGGVSAEFAAALPAVVLVLVCCLSGVQLGAQQVRLQDAAASAARAVARGDTVGAAAALARAQVAGASLALSARDDLDCATASVNSAGLPGLARIRLSATSCALGGGA
jgi:Flp pilus assembly protein TadG